MSWQYLILTLTDQFACSCPASTVWAMCLQWIRALSLLSACTSYYWYPAQSASPKTRIPQHPPSRSGRGTVSATCEPIRSSDLIGSTLIRVSPSLWLTETHWALLLSADPVSLPEWHKMLWLMVLEFLPSLRLWRISWDEATFLATGILWRSSSNRTDHFPWHEHSLHDVQEFHWTESGPMSVQTVHPTWRHHCHAWTRRWQRVAHSYWCQASDSRIKLYLALKLLVESPIHIPPVHILCATVPHEGRLQITTAHMLVTTIPHKDIHLFILCDGIVQFARPNRST